MNTAELVFGALATGAALVGVFITMLTILVKFVGQNAKMQANIEFLVTEVKELKGHVDALRDQTRR